MPAKNEPPLRLLTVFDMAEAEQTSTKTVRRQIANGEIPVIRIGRLVRAHPKDFSEYLLSKRQKCPSTYTKV